MNLQLMRLSVSNIAWLNREEDDMLGLLKSNGFEGLEIAPTGIWPDVAGITEKEALRYRSHVNDRGIRIIAMQSLLYGHPELQVFDSPENRARTLAHLRECIDLGARLGVRAFVFGSPRNRAMQGVPGSDHWRIAADFFREIGTYAHEKGASFCIEPNPAVYGTNFINTTTEAIDFVRSVDNPGLKVNVDTGTILLNREDYRAILDREAMDSIGHVHVSEPFIGPIQSMETHKGISDILKCHDYRGAVSIEMKKVSETDNSENVRDALAKVRGLYL